MKKKTS